MNSFQNIKCVKMGEKNKIVFWKKDLHPFDRLTTIE